MTNRTEGQRARSREIMAALRVCPKCKQEFKGLSYFKHLSSCGTHQGSNPSGLCECGCGQKTPLAKTTSHKFGLVKGEPIRFVKGHQFVSSATEYVIQDCGYTTACWIWQRSKYKGYGQKYRAGKLHPVHRLYYTDAKGEIPHGFQIDHLCRNPSCVNPDHLEAVPRIINVQRGLCAKLTQTKVIEILENTTDTSADLARQYGVSDVMIGRIRSRKAWKNIKFTAAKDTREEGSNE